MQLLTIMILISALSGCATAQKQIIGTPAPSSKFSKLQLGMGTKQVTDLIGQPNDRKTYSTGKIFIPFYFGGDKMRTDYFYKGEGQLTFSSGAGFTTDNDLTVIKVDSNATGYR